MNCEDGGELAQKTFGDGGALAQMVEGMVGDSHGWWGWEGDLHGWWEWWGTHTEDGGDGGDSHRWDLHRQLIDCVN